MIDSNRMGSAVVTCRLVLVVSLLPLACGCGPSDRPELGAVSGNVTLDGQPLASASVSFSQPGFRSSIGKTNAEGHYELVYLRDIKGAVPGTYLVKIKRFGESGQKVPQLPSRYNSTSELSREVHVGENQIDFDLSSKR